MPEDYFEVAYINFDEAILHGRARGEIDASGVRKEREVRIVLSAEQKRAIEDMNSRHQREMQKLLREMASSNITEGEGE